MMAQIGARIAVAIVRITNVPKKETVPIRLELFPENKAPRPKSIYKKNSASIAIIARKNMMIAVPIFIKITPTLEVERKYKKVS